MRDPKNWLAAALGVALVIALLAIANRFSKPKVPSVPSSKTAEPSFGERDPILGRRGIPGVESRARSLRGDTVIYDVTYRLNDWGRRRVPAPEGPAPTDYALFFGGSNTFGEAIEDDETLPYAFQQHVDRVRAYNYGYPGTGVQDALAFLEFNRLREQIQEPTGTAFYVFPAYHIDRAIGGSRTLAWAHSLLYYRLEEERPVRVGLFRTERPLYYAFAHFLGNNALARRAEIAWPPRITTEHRRFACQLLAELRSQLEVQLPGNRFAVVLYPRGGDAKIEFCLREKRIGFLDYQNGFHGEAGKGTIVEGDGHTNALGNRRIAEWIARDLPELWDAAP